MRAALEDSFRAFDEANPDVYHRLKALARAYLRRREVQQGRDCGISMFWEVLRWTYEVQIVNRDPIKLNNNHRAFYARKLMAHDPALAGLFRTRGRDEHCVCARCQP